MHCNNDHIIFYYEQMNKTWNEMKVNRINIYAGIGLLKEYFQNFYDFSIKDIAKLKNIEQEFKTIDLSTKDNIYQDLNDKIFTPLSTLIINHLKDEKSKKHTFTYLDKIKHWQERILKC